jgi:hypothetical protein
MLASAGLPGQATAYSSGEYTAEQHLFRSSDGVSHRLAVKKPLDSGEILWANLDSTFLYRLLTQLPSLLGLGALLFFSYWVQLRLFNAGYLDRQQSDDNGDDSTPESNAVAALFVTSLNAALPWVVFALATGCEVHRSESEAQASLMLKLIVARFINTALIPFQLMPIEETLTEQCFGKVRD